MLPKLPAFLAAGYEPLEVIGRGTSATVLRARQRELARTVILKVFHDPEGARSPLRQRVLREARLLSAVDHPRVVSLLDYGDQEGTIYFAYPDQSARSLASLVGPGERWSPKRCAALLDDVLAGLEHLHGHGIVHRDLKPANIVLDPAGRAQLIDLGLAKDLEATEGLTRTHEFVGTPVYAAPDQVVGAGYQEADDLYSAGVVAYELVSGGNPFVGGTLGAVFDRHLTLVPTPLAELDPTVPGEFSALVASLLAKSRDDRPVDAAAARRRLAPLLAGADGETATREGPDPGPGTASPGSRARPPGSGTAVLAAHPPEPRSGSAEGPAGGRTAGRRPAPQVPLVAGVAVVMALAATLGWQGTRPGPASGTGVPGTDGSPVRATGSAPAPTSRASGPGDPTEPTVRAAALRIALAETRSDLPSDPAVSHQAFWAMPAASVWLAMLGSQGPEAAAAGEAGDLLAGIDRSLAELEIEPVFEPFLTLGPLGLGAPVAAGPAGLAADLGLADQVAAPVEGWLAVAARAADLAFRGLADREGAVRAGALGSDAPPELELARKAEALLGGPVGITSLARRAADGPGTRAAWARWLEAPIAAFRRMLLALGTSLAEEPGSRARAALLGLAWCEGLEPLFAGGFRTAPVIAILGREPGGPAGHLLAGVLARGAARAQALAGIDPAPGLAAAAAHLDVAAGLGGADPEASPEADRRLAGRAMEARLRLATRVELARANLLRLTHRTRDHQGAAGLYARYRTRLAGVPGYERALVLGELVRSLEDSKDPLRLDQGSIREVRGALAEAAAALTSADRGRIEARLRPLRLVVAE